jgi:hypothetical protein
VSATEATSFLSDEVESWAFVTPFMMLAALLFYFNDVCADVCALSFVFKVPYTQARRVTVVYVCVRRSAGIII